MKLYAKVISERGKPENKGANEFLRIELNGESPDKYLLTMRIVPDGYGHAHIEQVGGSLSFLRALISMTNEAIAQGK